MTHGKKSILAYGMVLLVLAAVGCRPADEDTVGDTRLSGVQTKPTICTVNYPLSYFAQRIAGALAEIVFPAPADEDPAYWSPDPEVIETYQKADLILLNGAAYAKWVEKVSLPKSKMVNTSADFSDRYVPLEDPVLHTHGPEGAHEHVGDAFTTWLDLKLAEMHAEAVLKSLTELLPDHAEILNRNYEALRDDLRALDKELEKAASECGQMPLLGSHPVYQYLARGYSLNLKSVHWEPDEMPGSSQWLELDNLLGDHPAKWMIWEGEPDPGIVEQLESKGIGSIVFDPCGNVPDKGDFLSVMQQNVKNLSLVSE